MTSTHADKSGRGLFLAALNKAAAEKGFVIAASDLDFGPVEASSNPARQSQVAYTATPGSRFEGSQVAFYNRLDLTEMFVRAGIEVVEIHQGPATVEDVVVALNSRYGLGFTAADIDFSPVVEAGATSVVVTALESSYGFQGQLEVQLVEGTIPLAEVIVDPVLDGPDYPVPVPAYIITPVVITGTLTAKAVKENGTLLNGSGNPAGEMTIAQNGEIELALGARVWKSAKLPVPVDGHYDVQITDSGDWNFPISVNLLTDATPITDLYDVTLTLSSVETGVDLAFQLVRDSEGQLHFVNAEHDLDIADNVTTPAGDVTQNIQRATFYKAQLGEMSTNTAGSPIGDFVIALEAVRREGLTDVVRSEISVSVGLPV